MKAHIARNQNAGVPLALGWNLSAANLIYFCILIAIQPAGCVNQFFIRIV